MGAFISTITEFIDRLRSGPQRSNPTHDDIAEAARLRREQEEREEAARVAKEEAERLAREAEKNAQRARDARGALETAQAVAERVRREAEEEARARAAEAEAEREEAMRAAEAAEREAKRQQRLAAEETKRAEEAERVAELAAQAAEAERQEAETREQELREEARKAVEHSERQQRLAAEEKRQAEEALRAAEHATQVAEEEMRAAARAAEVERKEAEGRERMLRDAVEAAEKEARRLEEIAAEETRRATEAQHAAEDAARAAADEARAALAAKEEAERQLREGIQPVVMPSQADLEEAKRRIDYREGSYHFAVTGVAGSGKSSLINAFRGIKNRQKDAARTGVTETTLETARFPDMDAANPFVWYDVPGAGTLKVPGWQYFNSQGLYVFDALVVVFGDRFTDTDVAILQNARLFNIPCYIVRSKADMHVENLMKEMRDSDSDSDDGYAIVRDEGLESNARKEFIDATRRSVQDNLREAGLPDQPVYIVSNSTMLRAVKGKESKTAIDELELLKDFLGDAVKRRGASNVVERSSWTKMPKKIFSGL